MRLSTSRPKRSVPRGFSQVPRAIQTGGMDLRTILPSVGLCGASTGAHTAVTIKAANTTLGKRGTCPTSTRQRGTAALLSRGYAIAIAYPSCLQGSRQQCHSARRTAVANSRVEPAVEHVHAEIPDEVESAQDQHASLYDRIIARGDALQNEPSQPWPGEHGLRDHRAPQELHEEH